MLNKINPFLFKLFSFIDIEGRVNIVKVLIFLVLMAFIVIGPYWYYLSGNGTSKDPSNWGLFGDYIGGLLNPIFSLINIIILIYLTYIVSNKDDKRAFEEIKYKAYKELMHQFYNAQIEKEVYFAQTLADRAKELEKFIELYTLEFLFLFIDQERNIIAKLFGEFQATLKLMYQEYDAKKRLGKLSDELLMKTLINLYSNQKQNLIEFIQASLYGLNTANYHSIDNNLLIKNAKILAEDQMKGNNLNTISSS